MGATEFISKQAGEITFVDLPEEDDDVTQSKPMGSIESGKWVGRIYAVAARQAELADYRPPMHSTGRPYRVWVQANDDWAKIGGVEAYLRRYHPECLDLFGTIQTALQPTWQPGE